MDGNDIGETQSMDLRIGELSSRLPVFLCLLARLDIDILPVDPENDLNLKMNAVVEVKNFRLINIVINECRPFCLVQAINNIQFSASSQKEFSE